MRRHNQASGYSKRGLNVNAPFPGSGPVLVCETPSKPRRFQASNVLLFTSGCLSCTNQVGQCAESEYDTGVDRRGDHGGPRKFAFILHNKRNHVEYTFTTLVKEWNGIQNAGKEWELG